MVDAKAPISVCSSGRCRYKFVSALSSGTFSNSPVVAVHFSGCMPSRRDQGRSQRIARCACSFGGVLCDISCWNDTLASCSLQCASYVSTAMCSLGCSHHTSISRLNTRLKRTTITRRRTAGHPVAFWCSLEFQAYWFQLLRPHELGVTSIA